MSNHMTLDDRQNILLGLNTGESFSSIGKRIGKSVSTIGREIRNHRIVSETSGYGRVPNRCVHRFDCTVIELCQPCEKPNQPLCRHCRLCNQMCEEFQEERCARLDKPPYVCNGCMDRKACTLRKFIYDPCNAQDKYRTVLTESREGFNLTEREIMGIDKLVSPLLKKGQSVHHIVVNHKDELTVSEQTIERLIDASALSYLPEEQRRKYRIKHRKAKQKEVRVDRKCRIGRTLEDYNLFMQSHPQASPVQMDTVIGEIGGKCLFTMFFVNCSLMLAFLCDRNTAACIHEKIESLYIGLGQELFAGLFPVLLTDNGSEFSQPAALELDPQGNRRTYVFYCDPYASYQKASIERNHEFIRLVLPKSSSFDHLTQNHIDLLMSHINSYGRPSFQDKTPFQMFEFLYGSHALSVLMEVRSLNIIPPDDVVLTPELF